MPYYPSIAALQGETAAAFWGNSLLSRRAKYNTPSLRTYPCTACTEEETSFPQRAGKGYRGWLGVTQRGEQVRSSAIVREEEGKREQTAPSSLPHQRPCMAEIMHMSGRDFTWIRSSFPLCVGDARVVAVSHAEAAHAARAGGETPSFFRKSFGGALSVASRKRNVSAERTRGKGDTQQT